MASKAFTNDLFRLTGTYDRLRKSLLERADDGRLDKSLSYWVVPTDRRLPIAFLDRSLRDLLGQPLETLMATPGVGQKKILGFFELLRRASKSSLRDTPFGLSKSESTPANRRSKVLAQTTGFDATSVSESLWAQWCETVNRFNLSAEKLGRVAPSLQTLPTVIWHSRLAEYASLSLGKIRARKTHGEKRVHAVLEVFCTVHEALSTATLPESADLLIVPRFVPPLTRWLMDVVVRPDLPPLAELHSYLVRPFINQMKIDLGPHVATLAASRLCLDDDSPSVKQQADTLGVTRARVYQLLEDCSRVMEVRWPEGRWLLAPLATRFGTSDPETIGLMHGILDLFYPPVRSTAATPEPELSELARA